MIPIARPAVGPEELAEVGRVFDSGWLGMGSLVFDFEQALKSYLGARQVIAVNTGTSALHIALDALHLKPGDEVVVPSLTFAATIQAILACGAKPVFCEVEEATLNMDLADARKKLSSRTRVIMPVHYCGLPCDMDGLLALAEPGKIKVVEDAAHAFGSLYKGRKVGSFGHITCFSFDPIKTLTCGEGGAVVVHGDDGLAEEIVRKRILGIDKDTWHRYRNERSWFYEVTTPGFRYHMSNINAAIGLVQLKKLAGFIDRRRQIVRRYDEAFRGVAQLEPLRRDYEGTAFFYYILKVKDGRRNELLDHLNKRGVGAGVHYIPNHLQPLFKPFRTALPVTDRLFDQIISLPLYSTMTDPEVSTVISEVSAFFRPGR